MKKRIKNMIVVLGFIPALFIGVAPTALADSISTTGPNSTQTISTVVSTNTSVVNNNNVAITNNNTQTATSGNATVSGNTTGGNATTGNASNSNVTATTVQVNNLTALVVPSAGGNSSISNTGPSSTNKINNVVSNTSTVLNNNNVRFTNTNTQTATSGNATVSGNTTGGNATTGNASNTNETCLSVQINNGSSSNTVANNACAPTTTQPSTGGRGGDVLGASATLASIVTGGKGAGIFDQLPNTGATDTASAWFFAAILLLIGSVAYWRLAITPELKSRTL